MSFARWSDVEQLIVISNFDSERSYEIDLKVPDNIIAEWKLSAGNYELKDQLYGVSTANLQVTEGDAVMKVSLEPLQSFIFKLQ